LGQFSYNLTLVKTEVEEPKKEGEEKDEAKEQEKKLEKMIMGSKLMSGGFANRHLGLFSQKSIDEITQVCNISGDIEMQKNIKIYNESNEEQKKSEDEEEGILSGVIHAGKDRCTDVLIAFLHKALINPRRKVNGKMAMVPHARVGGEDGMCMHRCAFAVMLKFSGGLKQFFELRDEISFIVDDK